MQSKFYAFGLLGAALMAFSSGAGLAQPTDTAGTDAAPHERVTVYAPYVVTRKISNPRLANPSGVGIEVVTLSRNVSYSDLNLSQAEDQTTLANRVHQAAEDACKEIDRRYPKGAWASTPANQDCVGAAVNQAMYVVRDLEDVASVYGRIPR